MSNGECQPVKTTKYLLTTGNNQIFSTSETTKCMSASENN